MSTSKSEVKNHLTTNNVEHLTSPLIFTDESVHSTDSDITNDASINAKETHRNSLSNPELDELDDQLPALDYSKYLLDQQQSNSEHIQHDNYAQIPHEQDTTPGRKPTMVYDRTRRNTVENARRTRSS
ncbi:unnamed protein product [Rotaria sp. Silwood2]|nr:unnamed protein product [Rotaria sp. Silwood2]CAF2885243.1 unnamed protein product [Rotaria sp. Silwood2]CAF3144434.1 unnamed protein product [Rotaria sp. Silwood2]CAF4405681.1 unnamed protein product [Rotaria sp. Silwood2]CAF4465937.1 unnamed protein product [Rotaria sp. Silwood2]